MQRRNASTDPASNPATPRAEKSAGVALPAIWRRLLSETTSKRRTPSGSTLGFLLELLHDEPPAARVEIAPVLLETIAGGRLGRAVPLDPKQLTGAGLPAPMLRLAAGVLGLPQTQRKGRSYAHLSGGFGDALLIEILDCAPCLLGGVAGLRLARGKPRSLVWHWQLEDDGRQRLLPELPQRERLLRIGGLWYLDAEHAELGFLEGSEEEVALLDAPPLAPEYGEALAQALGASAYAKRIPAPRAFAAVERAELAPKPVLTLHALTRHARIGAGTPPLAYARLAFYYGGEKLPGRGGEPLVRRVRDGKLVEIARKRADELATMERMEGFGLAPAVDCEGLPWDMADALPEDAWLFPGKGYAGALEVNTPARWLSLREKLESDGFNVDYASTCPFEVLEGPPKWYGVATEEKGGDAFDFEIGIEVDGQRVNLLPAVGRALSEHTLALPPPANETEDAVWYAPVDDRRRVPVRLSVLRALLAPLAEYLQRPREMLRLPRVQAGRLEEFAAALPASGGKLEAPKELTAFTTRLREAAAHASDAIPPDFAGELRPYQREG